MLDQMIVDDLADDETVLMVFPEHMMESDDVQSETLKMIGRAFIHFMGEIDTREKEIAHQKIEEAIMWATKERT